MICEKALIRKENIGYILYSLKKKCYLFPNKEGQQMIDILIKNIKQNQPIFRGFNEGIQNEFVDVGIDKQVRFIDNTKISKRLLSVPLEYYFDYTNRCNLRCPHCYNINHLGTITMPSEIVRKIIKEMYKLGVMRIHLAGGEPTIDIEGLQNYLSTAYENGIVTSMATNGLLLNDNICELLIKNELFAVSISIDGYNEQSNALIRGKGNFVKACENVKKLVHKRNISKSKMEIALKPTYTNETELDFFEKMILLAIDLKVDKIKFANPERSLNHERGHYGKQVSKYYQIMEHIAELKEKYKKQINITNITNPIVGCPPLGLPELKGCIGGQELLAINPEGRISPCLMNDTSLGNYYEYGSIEKFLTDSLQLAQYLKKIDNRACHSCELYRKCRGGCQVRKIIEYGNTTEMDPYCARTSGRMTFDMQEHSAYQYFNEIVVAHSL